jgi:hypothetical protein
MIHLAATKSLCKCLFMIYARYGCIQVTSTIMTSSGTSVPYGSSYGDSAPEPIVGCCLVLLELECLAFWIDLSIISSQNTPASIGKY